MGNEPQVNILETLGEQTGLFIQFKAGTGEPPRRVDMRSAIGSRFVSVDEPMRAFTCIGVTLMDKPWPSERSPVIVHMRDDASSTPQSIHDYMVDALTMANHWQPLAG